MKALPKKVGMTMDDIMRTIHDLSFSQGSYGRLYNYLVETKKYDPDHFIEIADEWESQKFISPVDFILYLES